MPCPGLAPASKVECTSPKDHHPRDPGLLKVKQWEPSSNTHETNLDAWPEDRNGGAHRFSPSWKWGWIAFEKRALRGNFFLKYKSLVSMPCATNYPRSSPFLTYSDRTTLISDHHDTRAGASNADQRCRVSFAGVMEYSEETATSGEEDYGACLRNLDAYVRFKVMIFIYGRLILLSPCPGFRKRKYTSGTPLE